MEGNGVRAEMEAESFHQEEEVIIEEREAKEERGVKEEREEIAEEDLETTGLNINLKVEIQGGELLKL